MTIFLSRFIEFVFFSILAISLSKSWKTNIFSLGMHGFLLIGSYSVAFISVYLLDKISIPVNNFISFLVLITIIIFSGLISMLVSKIFFSFFSKLQEDYFAIATLAFSEILIIGIGSFNFLGGANGIDIKIPFINLPILYRKVFFAVLSFLFLLVFLIRALKKEDNFENIFLKAISQNETGIKHLGINTVKIKQNVFSETGFWTGIVGGIMAVYFSFISIDDFTFLNTIPILLFIVLGRYSVLKTLKMTFIIYIITEIVKSNFFGLINSDLGNILVDFQDIVYGILLILSVLIIYVKKNKINAQIR